MANIKTCADFPEEHCAKNPQCHGCPAYKKPTNYDRIRNKIANMTIDELIEFCGGESCENVICKEISNEHCRQFVDCGECIKQWLESEVEGE